jgi:hypothetical protein
MSNDELDQVFSRTWKNVANVIARKLGRELEKVAHEQYGVEISGGYPTEAGLIATRQIHRHFSEADWLVNGAPLIAAGLRPLGCAVEDYHDRTNGPSKFVSIAPGGWSGCERFMKAVLENPAIRERYYLPDRSNGAGYNFSVPIGELAEFVNYADWDSEAIWRQQRIPEAGPLRIARKR